MIALLSLVPAKKILFLGICNILASLLMNLFVSQLVKVILARVNLPLLFKASEVDISSTRKSDILDFSLPPIPMKSVEKPSKPIISAVELDIFCLLRGLHFQILL